MKKRTVLWILLALLIVGLLTACVLALMTPGYPGFHTDNAKLVVNGERLKEKCRIYEREEGNYISGIQLLAVVEGLGYDVGVSDDGTAVEINVGGEEYLLKELYIYKDDEIVIVVRGEPVSKGYAAGRPGEVVVDREEMLRILNKMGIANVSITLDPKGRRVIVNQESP